MLPYYHADMVGSLHITRSITFDFDFPISNFRLQAGEQLASEEQQQARIFLIHRSKHFS